MQQHRGVLAGRELLQLEGLYELYQTLFPREEGRKSTRCFDSNPIGNFALFAMTVAHKEPEFGFATRAIHVGSQPDPATGAVIPSVWNYFLPRPSVQVR